MSIDKWLNKLWYTHTLEHRPKKRQTFHVSAIDLQNIALTLKIKPKKILYNVSVYIYIYSDSICLQKSLK